MDRDFQDYIEALFNATEFDSAFKAFEDQVHQMGFDGALYTFIPKVLLDFEFIVEPVYKVSTSFDQGYLAHYAQARFDRHDPLIKAVQDGVPDPIDWWGELSESYKMQSPQSKLVIDEARSYGIQNGLTIPLMSGRQGISGASIISREGQEAYERLTTEKLHNLKITTQLFHSLVTSNATYLGKFSRPMLEELNDKERRYLAGLAEGKSASEIADSLCTTNKYLEQLMLKIRRKLSGVGPFDPPTINRNQVLYYAGLMNILEYGDSRGKH
ncbi:MAG: autoinducer binding domain-containing protein [Granulosicoccus sp.]